MSSSDKLLEILLSAYVELNKLNASPGDKAHMLAYSIKFLERHMAKIIKLQSEAEEFLLKE